MISFKNLRIHIYSDVLFRIEYQPEQKFLEQPTLLMGTQCPSEIPINVRQTSNTLDIHTALCHLHYENISDRFDQDILEITYQHGNERRLWTLKTQHTVPIYEVWRSLDQWSRVVQRHPIPIIINQDGWHKISDTAGAYWDQKKGWPTIQRPPYYENWYVFLYGNDFQRAFSDFYHLFGKPPLLPRHAFGAWYSRWHPYHQDELIHLIQEYKKNNIPLDIIVVDVDWHQEHWNGYDWRNSLFPTPQQFIQQIHELGMKLILNDHPGYEDNDPLPSNDSHLAKIQQDLQEPPYKGMWACDWTRQSAVQAWKKHCLQDLLAQGIDWWWIDGWTDYAFLGIDSQLWVNWQYYQAEKEFRPNQRALILSRWGGLGGHRYPIQFSGDTHSTFNDLAHEVEFTAYSGAIGANYWSHDIGGFHEGKIDEEVYIRWLQFGILSPIFRTHSNHGIREPFYFSNQALEIYRKYIFLRYRMIPYWEHLNKRYQKMGLPILSAMEFQFSQSTLATQYKHQYMIGEEILVAPILSPCNPHSNMATKEVWLPKQRWFDAIQGKWMDGNIQTIVSASIFHIPIYIASGAIIPTTLPKSPIPTGAYPELTLHLFGDITQKQYALCLDDGETDENSEQYQSTTLFFDFQCKENVLYIHCTTSENKIFLPNLIRFVHYPDTYNLTSFQPSLVKNNWENYFLQDIAENHTDCISWSCSIHHQTSFELEIRKK